MDKGEIIKKGKIKIKSKSDRDVFEKLMRSDKVINIEITKEDLEKVKDIKDKDLAYLGLKNILTGRMVRERRAIIEEETEKDILKQLRNLDFDLLTYGDCFDGFDQEEDKK